MSWPKANLVCVFTLGHGAVGSLCLAAVEFCLRCILGLYTATLDTWGQCHG